MGTETRLSAEEVEAGAEGDLEGSLENGEVTSRLSALEQQQAALAALTDPDVQEVIRRKQGGKRVKIEDLVEETSTSEVEVPGLDEEDLKDLKEDNPLRDTLKRLDGLSDKKLKPLLDIIGTLSKKVEAFEGFAGNLAEKEVSGQIQKTMEKYKDFKEYKKSILELSSKLPGLGVEDLYILARHRAGKLKISEPSTFTERPQTSFRRETSKPASQSPQRPKGRKGFQELLREKLDGLDLNMELEKTE